MENSTNIDSKFRLVLLAAKRAKQLLRGSRKRIPMEAENPLTIALEEIKLGLVDFEITDGTPRKPDLSIFGDETEAETEVETEAEDASEAETAGEAVEVGEKDVKPEAVTPTEEDAPQLEVSEEDTEVQPATE